MFRISFGLLLLFACSINCEDVEENVLSRDEIESSIEGAWGALEKRKDMEQAYADEIEKQEKEIEVRENQMLHDREVAYSKEIEKQQQVKREPEKQQVKREPEKQQQVQEGENEVEEKATPNDAKDDKSKEESKSPNDDSGKPKDQPKDQPKDAEKKEAEQNQEAQLEEAKHALRDAIAKEEKDVSYLAKLAQIVTQDIEDVKERMNEGEDETLEEDHVERPVLKNDPRRGGSRFGGSRSYRSY